MDVALSLLAALIATGFAVELRRDWKRRSRPHAAVWSVAIGAFALATWALFAGLAFGWNETIFRIFYYVGAIANIPLLAAGSVYLVFGPRVGRRFLMAVLVWLAAGALAVFAAPIDGSLDALGIPEGSDLFGFTVSIGAVTVPGPRFFAAFSGAVGTMIVIGLALYSAFRFWSSNRRLALGNVLIVAGILAPALGGSLTALGEGTALALSLLVGAVLLWTGYRVAVSARGRDGRAAVGPVGHDHPGENQ
jgi:hypothetical protein